MLPEQLLPQFQELNCGDDVNEDSIQHKQPARSVMPLPDYTRTCTACNSNHTKHCSRCKSAMYCSKQCQKSDWPIHRILCAEFAAFDLTSRPSEDHIRAILFPVDEYEPRFIWLHCTWMGEDSEHEVRFQLPDTQALIGPRAIVRNAALNVNEFLLRDIPDTIYLSMGDSFLADASDSNESIDLMAASTEIGHTYWDWRGPIVAFGMVGPQAVTQSKCRDIDMIDFRHVTDHLVWYKRL